MPRSRPAFAAAVVPWPPAADALPLAALLGNHPAVLLRGATTAVEAAELASRVLAARAEWTADFDGEQFALGRAFYTHLETGRSKEYFAHARASDALVERVLPGVQERTLALLGALVGGQVRRRAGFCGPGVHVFPAGGEVAGAGGVIHFDLEGLTEHQKARRHRAVTVVWTLQPAAWGGGLRLWDVLYDGLADTEIDAREHAHLTLKPGAGDAVLIDSRRLHQIRAFRGAADRISITVHGVEVDRGVWEAWF